MTHTAQYVVVGAIVAASALAVLRHVLPRPTRAVTRWCLNVLARCGVPIPQRWRNESAPTSGCASGCSSCSTSQCTTPAPAKASPVRFYRKKPAEMSEPR
ncbi:DUF6587 family protein [Pandoraea pnomenusa]|uniref:DUF6587 family protein n=1 Tax=Pandoraea pnomenusa TaxID=93220 RepID=UPI00333EFEF8